jgi:hypothetical protein
MAINRINALFSKYMYRALHSAPHSAVYGNPRLFEVELATDILSPYYETKSLEILFT